MRVKGNLLSYDVEKKVAIPEGIAARKLIGKDVTEWAPKTKKDERIKNFDDKVFGTLGYIGQELTEGYREFEKDVTPSIERVLSSAKSAYDSLKNGGIRLSIR